MLQRRASKDARRFRWSTPVIDGTLGLLCEVVIGRAHIVGMRVPLDV
jgi:hypothetical protein